MKIAYLDCISGASGDMLLGALVDAGLRVQALHECIRMLEIDGIQLDVESVQKGTLQAAKVNLEYHGTEAERVLPDIQDIITKSSLPEKIKHAANSIFTEIAVVEAGIHNKAVDEVHLHELGGIDTILDVAGVLWGFECMAVTRVYASPLPLGSGFQKSAHGIIPIPSPATVKLLAGIPVVGKEINAELVTPTGAALVKSLVSDFGPLPAMSISTVGYGAGQRDLDIPNVLRLLIGQTDTTEGLITETLCLMETNIDDLNPEIYAHLMSKLFEQNCLDVYLTPVQMKKNRPGTKLSVLCRLEQFDRLAEIIFKETTTTGIRKILLERVSLPRRTFKVSLPYGEVRIKAVTTPGGGQRFSPEYEDCQRLANTRGITLLEVYQAARKAAYEQVPW